MIEPVPPTERLTTRLRAGTRALHAQAERAGIMGPLLRRELPRPAYRALLASLLPIYEALEAALADPALPASLHALWQPGLARVPALRADLSALALGCAEAAPEVVPVSEAGAYAAHLRSLARRTPLLLAAHAYVRYLGDLNGGQVLARVVRAAYGDGAPVAFYAFDDGPALAASLREALDAAAPAAEAQALLLREAQAAFGRHVRLFEALSRLPAPAARTDTAAA